MIAFKVGDRVRPSKVWRDSRGYPLRVIMLAGVILARHDNEGEAVCSVKWDKIQGHTGRWLEANLEPLPLEDAP